MTDIDWDNLAAEIREQEHVEEQSIPIRGPAIVLVLRDGGPHECFVEGAWWQVLDSLPKNVREAAITLGDHIRRLPAT